MKTAKTQSYEVYLLDMWVDGDNGWVENERFLLGELDITPTGNDDVNQFDILNAMRDFTCRSVTNQKVRPLSDVDSNLLFIEDYYRDGSWWEIGGTDDMRPIYALKLKEVA